METPICDFVSKYAESGSIRLHMPGHKGSGPLGCEARDLTEIAGADNLSAPEGIIAESERNASALFGCPTFYSAEGSSLCIRAMLYLAVLSARQAGRKPVILAARNAHRTFLTAAVLLDFEIVWLPPSGSYLRADVSPDTLEQAIAAMPEPPAALWLTSPDYTGGIADIRAATEICRSHGILLLVDGAHGAYLRFLPQPEHPADLGADLCCSSAHKTLPVLTGGAYLHCSPRLPAFLTARIRQALALFSSTSPSYLILQSLDAANAELAERFPAKLRNLLRKLGTVRAALSAAGWTLCGGEPMKLTLMPKPRGYTGTELADILRRHGIFAEFDDPDHLVLMPSPYTPDAALDCMTAVLCGLPRRSPVTDAPPPLTVPERVCSPREALFSGTETLPAAACAGRVCAELAVSCPPAVPVVMCGERIDAAVLRVLRYYGVQTVTVTRQA
ncbi:MAG: amino acid decarboxylase [Oscillospiraceae bacterium]|nr:amino acid decarboxylase [Oscillospiraceae bacterium]